jgi:hypothetical protein
MAIEIWEDPEFPDVGWIKIYGVVTWDDYHSDIDEMLAFLKARGHPMEFVIITPSGFPKGNPLPHMRLAYRRAMNEPHVRRMIIVEGRSSSLATMLFYLLVRVGMIDGKRFLRVPDIDAAKDLLRSGVATDDILSQ